MTLHGSSEQLGKDGRHAGVKSALARFNNILDFDMHIYCSDAVDLLQLVTLQPPRRSFAPLFPAVTASGVTSRAAYPSSKGFRPVALESFGLRILRAPRSEEPGPSASGMTGAAEPSRVGGRRQATRKKAINTCSRRGGRREGCQPQPSALSSASCLLDPIAPRANALLFAFCETMLPNLMLYPI